MSHGGPTREEALAVQLKAEPHVPSTVRVAQPLRNTDAFFEGFGIEADDSMYLPPAERIAVW